MNHIQNHPAEELLTGFSAASLPLSQAACISAHLENCQACRQAVAQLNSVGSEFMQQLKPAPASAELKQDLLDRLDDLAEPAQPGHFQNEAIPRGLRQFIPGDYSKLPWKRVSPDIHSHELCRDSNGAKMELLRIRAGGKATTHTHMGDEYTVILEGSFSDEDGLYHRGDFLVRDASHRHTPIATRDRECICLAVTEAPIQFTGFFGRLLNPLIRRSYA